MRTRLTRLALALALAIGVAGCATPIAPTGGPVDRTPPRLVSSEPTADSVNVRTDRLVLEFSEPVEEASLRRALSVVPELPAPPQVVVRGRTAEVVFPGPLREATTYVVTIGTELQDLRNNRLPGPITLAFATGPQLDRGRIGGVVRDPHTGAAVANVDLFAYALPEATAALPDTALAAALPDPRTTPPDYRTQTDQQGRFQLDYLRDAPFFAVAVEDRNRNRRADPGEAFAVPRRPVVRPLAPDDTTGALPLELFVTRLDTLPPEPLRVRSLSRRRFALRFTEPVRLAERDPTAFSITDSLAGQAVIEAVYPDEDPFQLVFRTAPMEPRPHRLQLLRPEAVRDSVGNPARPVPLTFTPSAAADTLRPRLLGIEPAADRTLRPGERPLVRFSEPPDSTELRQRLAVTDAAGAPLPFSIATEDGVRFRVVPEAPGPFQLLVREPDTTFVRSFEPVPADSLGELSGTVLPAPVDVPVIIEVLREGMEPLRTTAQPDGSFQLPGLAAGEVRLRAFEDRDGSGRWDGGRLAPYLPPEPLALPPPVRVRARWDTALEPIRLDVPGAPLPVLPPPEGPVEDEAPADTLPIPPPGGSDG